ncbi:hypothetical protein EDB85DRAFT_1881692, partial [Lactarius pseudohatsudake]
FNVLPRQSALRLPVYNALQDLAITNDELRVLEVPRVDVEKSLSMWEITPSRGERLLQVPYRRLFQGGTAVRPLPLTPRHLLTRFAHRVETRHYKLSRIHSIEPMHDPIAPAQSDPTIFDLDPLN